MQKTLNFCHAKLGPYSYVDSTTGKSDGVNVEVLNLLAQKLNISIIWHQLFWSDCIRATNKGAMDGMVSLYKTTERQRYLIYPEEFLHWDESVFYHRSDTSIFFDGSLISIAGKTVAVAENNSYGEEFDQSSLFRKYEALRGESSIRMVIEGRVELGIGSRSYIQTLIEKSNLSKEITILSPSYKVKAYFAISKNSTLGTAFVSKLSDQLKILKKTVRYQVIAQKYEYINTPHEPLKANR
jgi:polar amino acid transport system substrate-binding protein